MRKLAFSALGGRRGGSPAPTGVAIVATGAGPLEPDEYAYGEDPRIVSDNGGIFSTLEWDAGDRSAREFRKTASIMKLVVNGYAGAGCIEIGGYDYHGGRRAEGEVKDYRAGRCMGACLEYAHRRNVPLMLYVFSDGSLSSNAIVALNAGARIAGCMHNTGPGGYGVVITEEMFDAAHVYYRYVMDTVPVGTSGSVSSSAS